MLSKRGQSGTDIRPLQRNLHWLILALLLSAAIATQAWRLQAQSTERAAVFVQRADGSTATACITLGPGPTTGLDLLRRGNFDVIADQSNSLGALVCKIGPDGCNYPAEACTCKYNSERKYWNFWQLRNGGWQFSNTGASGTIAANGDVHGWGWGAGASSPLPGTTFDAICNAVSAPAPPPQTTPTQPVFVVPPVVTVNPTVTPLPVAVATLMPVATPVVASAGVALVATPTANPTATATPTATPSGPTASAATPAAIAVVKVATRVATATETTVTRVATALAPRELTLKPVMPPATAPPQAVAIATASPVAVAHVALDAQLMRLLDEPATPSAVAPAPERVTLPIETAPMPWLALAIGAMVLGGGLIALALGLPRIGGWADAGSALTYLVISLIGVAAFLRPFWAGSESATLATIVIAALVVLCLAALLLDAQARILNSKTIALMGMLIAINSALRVIEVGIPGPGGFTPIFFLILLCGHVFGARFGFLFGALTLLISAFATAGVGPWLPFQMFTAGWMGLSAGVFGRLFGRRFELARLLALGAAWGFVYGLIMNLWSWPSAQGPAGQSYMAGSGVQDVLRQYAAYYTATSLVWDAFAAIGNAGLIALFGAPVLRMLLRYRLRFAFAQVALPAHALRAFGHEADGVEATHAG